MNRDEYKEMIISAIEDDIAVLEAEIASRHIKLDKAKMELEFARNL